MPYTKLEVEEYLKTLKDYSPEQLENVRKVRTEWENASADQIQMLFEQKLLTRKVKTKNKRSYWVCPDNGDFYYLNHYKKWFEKAFEWKS